MENIYTYDPKFTIAVDALKRALPAVSKMDETEFREQMVLEFCPTSCAFTAAWVWHEERNCIYLFEADRCGWTVKHDVSFEQWLANAMHGARLNQEQGITVAETHGHGLLTDIMTARQNNPVQTH